MAVKSDERGARNSAIRPVVVGAAGIGMDGGASFISSNACVLVVAAVADSCPIDGLVFAMVLREVVSEVWGRFRRLLFLRPTSLFGAGPSVFLDSFGKPVVVTGNLLVEFIAVAKFPHCGSF